MTVRVRLFAALREAAGVSEEEHEPRPLADLLADLTQRHGELFGQRLAVSSVLVNGDVWSHDDPTPVPDGAEVALLPPVSGGAAP